MAIFQYHPPLNTAMLQLELHAWNHMYMYCLLDTDNYNDHYLQCSWYQDSSSHLYTLFLLFHCHKCNGRCHHHLVECSIWYSYHHNTPQGVAEY